MQVQLLFYQSKPIPFLPFSLRRRRRSFKASY